MSSDVNAAEETSAATDQVRAWRPSLRPDHGVNHRAGKPLHIREHRHRKGVLGALVEFVRRPLVRVFIGLSLFIVAAIIFDATINGGSWTERAPKQKATQHKGAPRPPPSQ